MRVALVLAALLATAAPAAAQVESSVTMTVGVDAGPVTIAPGSSNSVPVTVTLAMDNLLCTAQATPTVRIEVDNSGPNGMSASLDNETLTFPPAQVGLVRGYSNQQTANLNITVGPGVSANHEHAYTITATFGDLGGCQPVPPATTITAEPATAEHAVVTGNSSAQPGQNGTPGNGDGGNASGGDEDSPLPLVVVVPALAIALLAARRRQQR